MRLEDRMYRMYVEAILLKAEAAGVQQCLFQLLLPEVAKVSDRHSAPSKHKKGQIKEYHLCMSLGVPVE